MALDVPGGWAVGGLETNGVSGLFKNVKIWLLAGELPGFLRGIAVVPMRKRLNLDNAQSTCRGQLTFPDPCPSISARVV